MKKNYHRFFFTLLSLCAGCYSYKTLTPAEFSTRTDYVVDQLYQLKKHAYLFSFDKDDPRQVPILKELGTGGTSANLSDFILRAPSHPQVAGLMNPGDRLRVIRIDESKSSTIGNFLLVFAEVTTGDCAGKTVELCLISKGGIGYKALVNSEFLEIVK